ncbi:transglutaminase family protein [Micromonospora sp. CPCC 205371]|nr:transglutaminase family protein [Micromonospora sp. CPCC 205371]
MATPATVVIQIAAARRHEATISERLEIVNNTVPMPAQELAGAIGGRQHLVHVEPGTVTVDYAATVAGGAGMPARVTDEERIEALRPSRYCPSDRLAGMAQSHFGEPPTALERVRAICDYVWRHVAYVSETSGPTTDAIDTLIAARGVCRDFAHLVAALCRAVDVPARIASVYAPGLAPMDFHAVVEAEIDGRWQVWDATRLAPRPTLVRIATGRDAADTAFITVTAGRAELRSLTINATAAGELPLDDHDQLAALG